MMGRICFLIALCSVLEFYKFILETFVGFLDSASSLKLLVIKYSDFGCGFLAFWCFSTVWNMLVLFFVLLFVFKVLQFDWYCKFRKGLSLNCSNGGQFNGVKSMSFKHVRTNMSRVSDEGGEGLSLVEDDGVVKSNVRLQKKGYDRVSRDEGVEEEDGCYDEDQVFDEMSLREMVKVQRQRANAAECELEKERMAAASAVDETMAMILRLQNDKSSLQMQVNQLQRWVEEKEVHDEGVIQSLEWIIMKNEYERSLLEDHLRICREKLKLYMKDEEWEQFDCVCPTSSMKTSCDGRRFDDLLISSVDIESSLM